ncbi:MAG: DUF3793 family protein [Bacillota bacterium]
MEMNKEHCYCLHKKDEEYIKWLIQLLGPVLLGAKPAEIMSFPKCDQEGENRLESVKKIFESCKKVSFIEIDVPLQCKKVIFYNSIALNDALRDARNLKFLKTIGYPLEYDFENYLNTLVEKIRSGNIPDEIGIFLGYPLKDVIGFIGHPALKLTKVNGWRIYGDPRVSDEKYESITFAKKKVKTLLQYHTPMDIVQYA